MTHMWRVANHQGGIPHPLADRKGEPVEVVARGRGPGPRNVLVRFRDGLTVTAPRFYIRKRPSP